MKRFRFRRGLRFLAFALLFIGLIGVAVMSLWNALLPDILHLPTISFGQALGLLALSRLLFGGFRGPWGRPGFGGPGSREGWKQRMTDRFRNLTPEQREAMRRQWRSRCGDGPGRNRRGERSPDASDRSGAEEKYPDGPNPG